MAERTRAVSRFFPFPLPFRSSERVARPTPPTPSADVGPAPRSVGGLLEQLLARGLAEPIATQPPVTEVVAGPERVEARLRALAAREAPAFVRTGSALLRGRLVASFADGPYPLRVALGVAAPEAPFVLEIEGYDSLHRFEVRRAVRIGEHVAVAVPEAIAQVRHRRARRAPAPAGFVATFRHPAFPDHVIRRPLLDLARGGICTELRPELDLLVPGLKIRDLVVTTPTGATLCFDASVRVLHPPRDGRPPGVGLQLTPSSAADARRWDQIVGDVLNPATQLGATWSEHSWELFGESGYFSLSGKSQAHFGALKVPFATAVRKIDAAPALGCQVSWPSERGIEASLSMLKPYTHTWFGFQMAKRPGDPTDGTPGKDVLRDIHLRAYEHAAADPALRWVWGVVQASAKWSKLVHQDLPQRYVDDGMACILPFHAVEVDAIARAAEVPGLELGPATAADEARLLDHVARNRPWVYREAFDLVPERFALGSIREAWSGAGLTRERALLVARRDGVAVAAALVESADPGLHLFNLLDVVRLFALAPGGEDSFRPLVGAAAAWYRARGRTGFTCLLEEGDPACLDGLPARPLGQAYHTLLAAELVPSLLEHVHEVTAPKLARAT